jgi:condensin-2 complex subunit D3
MLMMFFAFSRNIDDDTATWEEHAAQCLPDDVLAPLFHALSQPDASQLLREAIHSNNTRALAAILAFVAHSSRFGTFEKNKAVFFFFFFFFFVTALSERSMLASAAWMALIGLNSQTHAYFRSTTLHTSLAALRRWLERHFPRLLHAEKNGDLRKHKLPAKAKQAASTASKKRRATKHQVVVDDEADDDGAAAAPLADDDGDDEVSIRDVVSVQWPLVLELLAALDSFLARFPLAPHRESAMQCASVLAELLRAEATSTLSGATCAAVRLASAAERCLDHLLVAHHGAARDTVVVAMLAPLLGTPRADGSLPPRTPSVVGAAALRARARVLAFAQRAVAQLLASGNVESPMTLVQHLCARAPDRTEYRALASAAAAELAMPIVAHGDAAAQRWHTFAQRLSRQTRPACRATAVELACAMARRLLAAAECADAAALARSAAFQYVLVLVQRATDKHPTVRQRALHCVGSLLDAAADPDAALHSAAQRDNLRSVLLALPDGAMVDMLKRRLFDSRVNVRRCALQLAAQLFAFEAPLAANDARPALAPGIVECLLACIEDESVLVRKAAAQALSSLLVAFGESDEVRSAWCAGVLPLSADAEPTVAAASVDALSSMLLARLCASHAAGDATSPAWELLALALATQMVFVERALAHLASHAQLDATALCAAVRWRLTPQPQQRRASSACALAAWQLYAALVPHANKKALNADFVLEQWRALDVASPLALDVACALLGALGALATRIAKADAEALGAQLLSLVVQLRPFPMLARAMMAALARLDSDAGAAPRDWLARVIDCCDAALALELEGKLNAAADMDRVLGALLALGEATQRCDSAARVPQRAVTMVTLLAARDKLPADIAARLAGAAATAMPRVRAHAVVTLGKLCLLDVQLARQLLGTFAKELQLSVDAGDHWRANRAADGELAVCGDDDAVRNNVVVVLCDLCTRHTHLIDTQLPLMANLVADGNALIRRQLLQLLSDLLRENYIKWRSQLVMRVALCLADECDSVCALATTLIEDFAAQQADHVANVFVELLFHACGCYAHPRFNREHNTNERERDVFHLGDNVPARLRVYKAFLAVMSDEAKFAVQADIVQNVLTSFVGGDECQLPLGDDDACQAVLADALAVLAMPEAQLSAAALADSAAAEPADDAADPAALAVAAAHGRMLKRVVEKSVTEHTIPVCVALKATLEQQHSTLLHNLMYFLVQIFKLHEGAVEDALAGNRRLARELRYDLERFEKAHARAQQMTVDEDDDSDDNDDNNTVATVQPAVQPVQVAPVTPFRTPSRARFAANTDNALAPSTPMSVVKVKRAAVAATTPAAPVAPEATPAAKPKTPWSTLRVKSMTTKTGDDLSSVAAALSFGADNEPLPTTDNDDDADDAFVVAATPKRATRVVEQENARKNNGKRNAKSQARD